MAISWNVPIIAVAAAVVGFWLFGRVRSLSRRPQANETAVFKTRGPRPV